MQKQQHHEETGKTSFPRSQDVSDWWTAIDLRPNSGKRIAIGQCPKRGKSAKLPSFMENKKDRADREVRGEKNTSCRNI